jgi:hypothetical protein
MTTPTQQFFAELMGDYDCATKGELNRRLRRAVKWANKHDLPSCEHQSDCERGEEALFGYSWLPGEDDGDGLREYLPSRRYTIQMLAPFSAWRSRSYRRLLSAALCLAVYSQPAFRRAVQSRAYATRQAALRAKVEREFGDQCC